MNSRLSTSAGTSDEESETVESSPQGQEVAHQEAEATMNVCDWCSVTIGGAFVEHDGSKWHPGCLGLYLRYKGKPLAEVPPEAFVCPMGGHTHRNPS